MATVTIVIIVILIITTVSISHNKQSLTIGVTIILLPLLLLIIIIVILYCKYYDKYMYKTSIYACFMLTEFILVCHFFPNNCLLWTCYLFNKSFCYWCIISLVLLLIILLVKRKMGILRMLLFAIEVFL